MEGVGLSSRRAWHGIDCLWFSDTLCLKTQRLIGIGVVVAFVSWLGAPVRLVAKTRNHLM